MAQEKVTVVYKLIDNASSKLKDLRKKFKSLDVSIKLVRRSANALKSGLSGIGGGFKKLGGAVFSLKSLLGAAGLAGGIKMVTSLFQTQRKVLAQTEAALKSTGNASGLTAKEINNMAVSLQKVTNFGDEVIQSGQNILLTFKNIGKEIFSRTTSSILDLATAMKVDVKSAAIQIGKALNDPITGLTMLTRVGITFTESQKEQIKTMQEAGDLIGAQTIILKELESQFGGSARALVDPVIQMENALGDLGEVIGEKISPLVNSAAISIKNFAEKSQEFIKEFNFTNVLVNVNKLVTGIKIAFANIQTNVKIQAEIFKEIIKRPFSFSTYKVILDDLLSKMVSTFKFASKISNLSLKKISKFREKLLKEDVKSNKTFEENIADIKKEGKEKQLEILKKGAEKEKEILKKSTEVERKEDDKSVKNHAQSTENKTAKTKEQLKEEAQALKTHQDKLVSLGKEFGRDFESGLRSTVGTLIEGENGITSQVSKGLAAILPGIGSFIGGGIGGLIFNLFDNIFGSSSKKQRFQEEWKNHLKELRAKTNQILEGIGKKRDPFERQLDLLSELKTSIGLGGIIGKEFAGPLGVAVGTTVKDAIESVGDKLKNVNDEGLKELNADLQSVLSEVSEKQELIDKLQARRDAIQLALDETLSKNSTSTLSGKLETQLEFSNANISEQKRFLKDLQKIAVEKQSALSSDQVIVLDQILDNIKTLKEVSELTETDTPDAINALPYSLVEQLAQSQNRFIPSSSILSTPQDSLLQESTRSNSPPGVSVIAPQKNNASTTTSNELNGVTINLVMSDGKHLGKATFEVQQEMLLNGEISESRA